ncbi:MAG: hypothetical protein EOO94_03125 [Pedobacter sp.]|nr:MAG: hypothetical protein EOO94_03125 [Pedobacter sp.]
MKDRFHQTVSEQVAMQLILSNFAMHLTLSSDEKEKVLAYWQQKIVNKKTFLLQPGKIDRQNRF